MRKVLLAAAPIACALFGTSAAHAAPRLAFSAPLKWSETSFCYSGEECRIADVNNDGKKDLVAFTHSGKSEVFVGLSNGSSFGPPQKWSNLFCAPTESCEVGDVDGDGAADLIAFTRGTSHAAWVALSNGASFGAPQQWSSLFCMEGEVCKVADMNGDGMADLVTFTKGESAQVWVALANGTAFGGAQKWSDYFCAANETCDLADVNGDGRADAITFTKGAAHQVWVGLSNGGGLASPQKWSDQFCLDGEVCEADDFNGDGRADLVSFTHGAVSQVWVALAGGGQFVGAQKLSDYFCAPYETCAVGDVNHDGRADVIALTRDPNDEAWVATLEDDSPLTYNIDAVTVESTDFFDVAANANVHLTLNADGSYDFHGHFHDSGHVWYDDSLVLAVKTATGKVLTFAHSGTIHGDDPGPRDDDWSVTGTNPAIAASWGDLKNGYSLGIKPYVHANAQFTIDIASLWNEVQKDIGIIQKVISIAGPILAAL